MLNEQGKCFHLGEVPRAVNFIKKESRVVVARGWGGRHEELLFCGYRVSLWEGVALPVG